MTRWKRIARRLALTGLERRAGDTLRLRYRVEWTWRLQIVGVRRGLRTNAFPLRTGSRQELRPAPPPPAEPPPKLEPPLEPLLEPPENPLLENPPESEEDVDGGGRRGVVCRETPCAPQLRQSVVTSTSPSLIVVAGISVVDFARLVRRSQRSQRR